MIKIFNKKKTTNDRNDPKNWGKVNDTLGVSIERSDEIINEFHHGMIDSDQWTKIWARVQKILKGPAEHAFAGYVFGRMYSAEELKHHPEKLIAGMLHSSRH